MGTPLGCPTRPGDRHMPAPGEPAGDEAPGAGGAVESWNSKPTAGEPPSRPCTGGFPAQTLPRHPSTGKPGNPLIREAQAARRSSGCAETARDARTARPQTFRAGDRWFPYNLAVNLSQMQG